MSPTSEQVLDLITQARNMVEEGPLTTSARAALMRNLAELAYAAGAAAEALKWTEALADLQVINWVAPVEDPRQAIQDLINANVQIALDPAVSSDAQALIDRGAASMRDCRTCRYLYAFDYCGSTAQCINASQYTPIRPLKMWRKE